MKMMTVPVGREASRSNMDTISGQVEWNGNERRLACSKSRLVKKI